MPPSDTKDIEIPVAEKADPNFLPIKDGDAALEFLRTEGATGEILEVDEKALVRKIDWMIMPLMFGCYCLQYLDKTLINYAAVMGLFEDVNIDTNQFSDLAWVFYVSYLAFEFPHGYGMQHFPTAKYIGTMVICWGIVVAATSACSTYAGLIVTRVLLGVFESAIAPSLILITGMWYKKKEQPPRMGIWYCGTAVGTVVGSLMSFGFQHYESLTFTSWQIMFLVVGLLTTAIGILVVFFLPDNPMSSRLSHAEKVLAIERLRSNQTGIENVHFKRRQALECFRDPQAWLLSAVVIASNVPNGAVSSYQATIIKNFGYSSKTTALLYVPSGGVALVSIVGAVLLAGRWDQRGVPAIVPLVPGVLGGCLMAFLPPGNKAGKLAGIWMINAVGATLPLTYAWVAANFAGHTKKVTMNAMLLMSFCLANIIGPLTFRNEDAPDYYPAKVVIVAATSIAIGFIVALRFYYIWENKRRDRRGRESHEKDVAFLDLTDRENVEFRYRL
ncbi:allantoin permease [Neofusicoccum parvum]|nr:allantoin permease [Neofusicoccum parvum]